MTNGDEASRAEIRSKLAESRAELRRVLDPPPNEHGGDGAPGDYQKEKGSTKGKKMKNKRLE